MDGFLAVKILSRLSILVLGTSELLAQGAIFGLSVFSGRVFLAILEIGLEVGHVFAKSLQTPFFLQVESSAEKGVNAERVFPAPSP